jgi:hypothetical protein
MIKSNTIKKCRLISDPENENSFFLRKLMEHPVSDIANELAYFSLFENAEKARWKITEIPWDQIDKSKVDAELIALVKSIVASELTTFSATRSFMALFEEDIDFTQWLAVWFYEETKHPHVLIKWLSMVGESVSGQFLLDGREIQPMNQSKVESLTFNIISEIVAGRTYLQGKNQIPEPVLRIILDKLGKDEMRHSVGFAKYCKKWIDEAEDPDKERTLCLRATWVFLDRNVTLNHPIALLARQLETNLGESTIQDIRSRVASRISKVVGVDIPDADSIYEVYQGFKGECRQKKRAGRRP